ncbi:hypothetical protein F2Q69_00035581 [Brassica cretica]|uniref:Uncharacterized protein n=1 Tax=Brassica cretica TaxID=69181 RepID=A0A8S9SUP5_BRACR|nr:hypothetical protein F2Q69_00035581 [Brassica cretica]
MTLSRRRMAVSLGGWLRTNCVMTQTQANLTFKEAQKFELPEIVAGATSPTDRASLVPTVNRSSSRNHRPRHNRSPDEAVRAVRNFDVRARVVHAPSPGIVSVAVAAGRNSGKPPSPPVTGSTGGLTGLN